MSALNQTMAQLLAGFSVADVPALAVSNAVLDSRDVRAGDVFVALKGAQTNGAQFIDKAIAQGASACVLEAGQSYKAVESFPIVEVAELATRLPEFASRLYGNASAEMLNFAVTGTNGKTSCCLAFAAISSALGKPCGSIGTLGWGMGEALTETRHTTPDTLSLYRIMSALRAQGCSAVAMEMSSHALEQERAAGLALDVALITNITRDHLDYHGSFEEYAQAKGQLLRWPALKLAVVNADDEHCARLAVDCQRLTYSANGNSSADVWVENVKSSANGLSATVHTPWGSSALKTPLLARFNLSNLLGVITALVGMGNALSDVIDATAAFTGVPGRLQRVNNDKGFTVLVDYAHTPDALENALCALRPLTEGRLLLLFGCGGDRDRGKRPLMGEVAARLADKCVVTSDNPRSEAPQQIIDDICAGMTAADYDICVDRAEAIAAILAQAKAGDIVLLAGKGHETYQELATETIDFDDVAVAAASLQAGGVH